MDFCVICGFSTIGLMLAAFVYCLTYDYWCQWSDKFFNWLSGVDTMRGSAKWKEINRKPVLRSETEERMESLIKELIKATYCKQVLNNPPFTEYNFNQRMLSLQMLEIENPELKKWYSPTQYKGYNQGCAVEAFGANEWYTMVTTLDYSKPDAQPDVDDYEG